MKENDEHWLDHTIANLTIMCACHSFIGVHKEMLTIVLY